MITLGILFVLLNLLDILLTYLGLQVGAHELNPIAGIIGWRAMNILKLSISFIAPLTLMWINKRSKRPIGTYAMNAFVILMITVCIWNVLVILTEAI